MSYPFSTTSTNINKSQFSILSLSLRASHQWGSTVPSLHLRGPWLYALIISLPSAQIAETEADAKKAAEGTNLMRSLRENIGRDLIPDTGVVRVDQYD